MEDVSLTALILENIVGQKEVLNEVVQKNSLKKLEATSKDIHLYFCKLSNFAILQNFKLKLLLDQSQSQLGSTGHLK